MAVAEEFLDRADIVAVLEEVRHERMPQGVAARRLGEAACANGAFDSPLKHGFVKMLQPDPTDVTDQWFPDRLWQKSDPVLAPLAVPNEDFPAGKVDILDPEPRTFHQAEAGAVEQ